MWTLEHTCAGDVAEGNVANERTANAAHEHFTPVIVAAEMADDVADAPTFRSPASGRSCRRYMADYRGS